MVNEKESKDFLSNQIKLAIELKQEFGYLEQMCEVNEISFNKEITNYCLDTYLDELNYSDKQKSKYVAMWETCMEIMGEW